MHRKARQLLLHALALAALLGVFWLYTRPDFVVEIANQLWSCL